MLNRKTGRSSGRAGQIEFPRTTIAKRIQQVSQEALQIQQGSLYPALHRLEQQAWIKAEWRPTETGRMAKFDFLTRSGRKQLERELANWSRLSTGINLVVQEV